MSTQATLQAPAALKPPATRLIRLIGLTLALGYLIVLAGAYLKGEFPIDPQGRLIANDFVNVMAAGRLTLASEPVARTTGRCTNKPKSAPSATTSRIITAGTIRRLPSSLPRRWRRCLI